MSNQGKTNLIIRLYMWFPTSLIFGKKSFKPPRYYREKVIFN